MVPPNLQELLEAVECKDLYEFLEQERDAALEDLQAAAETKYRSLHGQNAETNTARADLELAGLCMSDVFRDARNRREYDDSLAQSGRPGRRASGPVERRTLLVAAVAVAALVLAALAVELAPLLSTFGERTTESTEHPGAESNPPSAAEEAEADATAAALGGGSGGTPTQPEGAGGTPEAVASAEPRAGSRLAAPDVAPAAAPGLDAEQAADPTPPTGAPVAEPPRASPPPPRPADPVEPRPANPAAPEAREASLVVRTEPGASIDLDGMESGRADDAGMLVLSGLQPGRHVVVARKQGYASATTVVEVAPGRSEVVELAPAALPGMLTVQANVADATLRIDGGEEHPLPLLSFEVAPGSRRLTAARPGFRSAEHEVDVRPGEAASLDIVLEPLPLDELLREAQGRFDAGRHRDAADGAQAVVDLRPDAGEAHLLLGRALYELRRFEESARSLARAVTLGQEVTLAAKHRHGGLGVRAGFCPGVLSFSRDGVAFRSATESDHGFVVAPGGLLDLEPERTGGRMVRIDARILETDQGRERRRNFDFLHKDTERTAADDSGLRTGLSCRRCDASMDVQLALMRHVNQPAR